MLIKTSLFHHASLLKLSEKNQVFKSKWNEITQELWTFLQEIQAVCYELSSYALMEAQVDCMTASQKLFLH